MSQQPAALVNGQAAAVDLIESMTYAQTRNLGAVGIRDLAKIFALVPGSQGESLRRGLIHSAAELAPCFAHELIESFEETKRPHAKPDNGADEEFGYLGDFGA